MKTLFERHSPARLQKVNKMLVADAMESDASSLGAMLLRQMIELVAGVSAVQFPGSDISEAFLARR